MKASVLIFSIALAACGGGGGNFISGGAQTDTPKDTVTETTAPTCTYPKNAIATNEDHFSDGKALSFVDTSKKYKIFIQGDLNQLSIGECVFVEKITLNGKSNTVKTVAKTNIAEIYLPPNSFANSVSVPDKLAVKWSDFGNNNSLNSN